MNSQDVRFKNLRKKLDSLNYFQTLHPDSIELVEKILNDYFKLSGSHEKLKKAQPKDIKPINQNLEHQLDLINEQNHALKMENQKLREQIGGSGIQQKMKKLDIALQSCRTNYEYKVDQLSEQIKTLQRQNQSLKDRNLSLQVQNERGTSNNYQKLKSTQDYNSELTNLLEKKKKQIQDLQQNNSKMRLKISSLEKLIQQSKQQTYKLVQEATLKNSNIIQILREELVQAERQNDILKLSNSDITTELTKLKSTISSLNKQVSLLENEGLKNQSTSSVQNSAKNKLEEAYEEAKALLASKMEANDHLIRQKEESQAEIQRLNTKIKQLSNKNKVLNDNITNVQSEIQVINQRLIQKVKQGRQVEAVKAILERKIKEYQSINKDQKEEVTIDNSTIKMELQKQERIFMKKMSMIEEQIKIMKEKQHQILMQKEKYGLQVKKLTNIISEGNKQLQIMQTQKQALMRQNQHLQTLLTSTQNTDYGSRNELIRINQKITSQEILIQDLKTSLKGYQNNDKINSQQISKLQSEIRRQQQKSKEIFEDNKQLKILCESLEKTKKELFQKYKLTQNQNNQSQSIKIQYQKQFDELKILNQTLKQQLKHKEISIITIDNQRDQLQNVLDEKTVQNEQQSQYISRLQKQINTHNRSISQSDVQLHGLSRKLSEVQNQYEKCVKKIQMLEDDLYECKNGMNKRDLVVGELQNEAKLLVMGKRELERQSQQHRGDIINLQRKYREKMKDYDQMREKVGQLKIQLNQLTQSYQCERSQNIKLKGYLSQAEAQNHNIYNHIQKKDEEIQALSIQLQNMERRQSQYVRDITSFEHQLSTVSEHLARRQDELDRVLNQRDAYKAQTTWKRQSTIDWKSLLQEKNFKLTQQFQLKKRQCDSLRANVRECQRAIEQQRMRNFTLERYIETLKGNGTPIKLMMSESRSSLQKSLQNCNSYNNQEPAVHIQSNLYIESNRGGQSFESSNESLTSKKFQEKVHQLLQNFDETKRQENRIKNRK